MYRTFGSVVRDIMEKRARNNMAPDGGPEKDMNDQIAVGSYQTKSFEMSNAAQKLYSDLPSDTPSGAAESCAIELDKLFGIDKDTTGKDFATLQDHIAALACIDKIKNLSKDMKLESEHDKIVAPILKRIKDHFNKRPNNIINPEDYVHPTDDPRYGNTSKDYATDRVSDRDVDNVKKFLVRRSLKAQRKLKITDND